MPNSPEVPGSNVRGCVASKRWKGCDDSKAAGEATLPEGETSLLAGGTFLVLRSVLSEVEQPKQQLCDGASGSVWEGDRTLRSGSCSEPFCLRSRQRRLSAVVHCHTVGEGDFILEREREREVSQPLERSMSHCRTCGPNHVCTLSSNR